jgi:hypothetical protein
VNSTGRGKFPLADETGNFSEVIREFRAILPPRTAKIDPVSPGSHDPIFLFLAVAQYYSRIAFFAMAKASHCLDERGQTQRRRALHSALAGASAIIKKTVASRTKVACFECPGETRN